MTEATAASSIRSYFTSNPAFPILFLVMFSGTAGMGMVSPLLPIFAEEMGASGVWLGLAFSGFAITQTPLMPIFGRWSDASGRRMFLAAGLAVYVLVALGMILAPNFYALVILRMVSGIGAALLFPIAMAYAGEISPKGEEGVFMGVFNVAFYTGWGIGPLMGGLLSDTLGMDAAFASQALLASFALAVVLTRLPEPERRTSTEDDSEATTMQLLRERPIQALASFQVLWAFNSGIALSFLALYMTDELGAAAALAGLVISTRTVLNGVLQTPGGRLADRANRRTLMASGMLMAGLATFLVPALPSVAAVWSIFAFIGIAESIATPAANALAVEAGRERGMGTLMGIFNTAFSVGTVAGALIGGLVADLFGIENTFRVGGTIVVLGILVFLALTRRLPARAATIEATPAYVRAAAEPTQER